MVGDRRYGWLGLAMLPVKAVDTLQPLYGLTAFFLIVAYAAAGRLDVLFPVAGVIGAKIAIDLAFHLWSVHLYRRWVGDARRASFGAALLAALVEPFTFQLLRHAGAMLGWLSFLTGAEPLGASDALRSNGHRRRRRRSGRLRFRAARLTRQNRAGTFRRWQRDRPM